MLQSASDHRLCIGIEVDAGNMRCLDDGSDHLNSQACFAEQAPECTYKGQEECNHAHQADGSDGRSISQCCLAVLKADGKDNGHCNVGSKTDAGPGEQHAATPHFVDDEHGHDCRNQLDTIDDECSIQGALCAGGEGTDAAKDLHAGPQKCCLRQCQMITLSSHVPCWQNGRQACMHG